MPSSSLFSGAPFSLQSVTPKAGFAGVRVRFFNDPLAANPAGANDALNPLNYTITGPRAVVATSCAVVLGDPQSIDVFFNVPLVTGSWTLTVANIHSVAGDSLTPPISLSFTVSVIGSTEAQNKGAVNDDAETLLRKNLCAAMEGPAWNALIAAIATGDKTNFDNARLAFDQKYISTASDFYLDRKVADVGMQRPETVGMDDDDLRSLAIKVTSRKLTPQIMYEILEIFYGSDATRAFVTTGGAAPFALNDGDDFTVLLDEKTGVQCIFSVSEFASIAQASALEVAASITRSLRAVGSKAFAVAYNDPGTNTQRVRIYSSALGLGSGVRVTNGKAQNILQFPTLLLTHAGAGGVQTGQNWAVSIPRPGVMRLTLAAASTTDLNQVRIGDYVNIFGANFASNNKGSYTITNVDVRYITGTLTQFIEVANTAVSTQASVNMALSTDLLFFRPTKASISSSRTVVVAQTKPGITDVVLPATTTAVKRHKTTGAYLHQRLQQAVSTVTRFASSVLLTFPAPHSIQVGEKIIVDNLFPTSTLPAVTAGNGTTTTDASTVSPWSTLHNSANAVTACAGTTIGNTAYMVGGDNITAGPTDNGAQTTLSIFSVSGSSVLADSSTQYTYATSTGAAMPVGRYRQAIVNLNDSFNTGRFMVIGGVNTALTTQTDSYIYNPTGNSWSAAINMATPRSNPGASVLNNTKVLVTGGLNGATFLSSTELFTASGAGAGAFSAGPTMAFPRTSHTQVTLSDGRVLVAGGITASGTKLTASCEIYDPTLNVWVRTGDMAFQRELHTMTLLPNDRVLVTGGAGWPVNMPGSGSAPLLNSAEIWDPKTGRWTPAGYMSVARAQHRAIYLPASNRVIVFGSGAKTEFFKVASGKWSRAPRTDSYIEDSVAYAGLLANGTVFAGNGLNSISGVTVATQRLWIPESDVLSSGGLNGRLHTVQTVPAPNQLTITTSAFPDALVNASSNVLVTPATAIPDASFPGPFVYEPASGVGISNIVTTTTVDLNQGQQYPSLKVTDASKFPDAGGFVSLAFGTKLAVQPLRFLGKISNTELILDFSTKMPVTLPTGTSVTLLVSKTPFVPANSAQVGSFYLTASSAGRVAASAQIDSVAASGFTVDKTIQYPGDRGLGGEGLPAEGAQKLSDKVGVWAGDDEDAEIAQSRVGV